MYNVNWKWFLCVIQTECENPWCGGMVLRVEEHLEKLSPMDDSSLKTVLGLWCFCLGLGVLGFTRPCSSKISCCFLRRYSCFISSRRFFSSSLRWRSSSAFRLMLESYKLFNNSNILKKKHFQMTLPGFISFLLRFCFKLLFAKSSLLSFFLLLQQERCSLFGKFILCFLFILNNTHFQIVVQESCFIFKTRFSWFK